MGRAADVAAFYRSVLPVELLSLPPGMISGVILAGEEMTVAMAAYPGLLMMVPAIMATRGNVFGAMGARLTTGLYQGIVEPSFRRQAALRTLLTAVAINSMFAAFFISGVTWTLLTVLGPAPAPFHVLFGIALVSAVLSLAVLSTIVVVMLFWGYRRGINPEILNGPVVSTAGDVFGLLFIHVAVTLMGVVL